MYIEWDDNINKFDCCDDLHVKVRSLFLVSLQLNRSFFANVVGKRGDILSVGISPRLSTLSYNGIDGNPPYFSSFNGNNTDETMNFDFFGSVSEVLLSTIIDIEHAIIAVNYFCLYGGISTNIRWKEH